MKAPTMMRAAKREVSTVFEMFMGVSPLFHWHEVSTGRGIAWERGECKHDKLYVVYNLCEDVLLESLCKLSKPLGRT